MTDNAIHPETAAPAALPKRLSSLDAYRGFVMFLMMAEVLRLHKIAEAYPASAFWNFLAWHQSHVEWVGCALHDLIQPSFSFIVGVALPFSLAARSEQGQTRKQKVLHAFRRALILVALGVLLRLIGSGFSKWTFEDTLSQIGLGYGFLFLLGLRSVRIQWISFAAILVGYWVLFALYPLPGPDFDWAAIGLAPDWPGNQTGFAAHWNKNTNPAWAFDTWFLNLFPQKATFVANGGGYATLSFIPTLGTMILGLITGNMLRTDRTNQEKIRWMLVAGIIALFSGWLLDALGLCPVVKRIWTPGWVLFAGGWSLLLLAAFYAVIDTIQVKKWSFPFIVIGMNSIAAYLIADAFGGPIHGLLETVAGESAFELFGAAYSTLFQGAIILLVYWLLLYGMYKRRLFLRI